MGNVIEHCFVLCTVDIKNAECLPKRLREGDRRSISIKKSDNQTGFTEVEKELIISVLEKNNWNRAKSSKELNIDPSTLWRKMKKLKILL